MKIKKIVTEKLRGFAKSPLFPKRKELPPPEYVLPENWKPEEERVQLAEVNSDPTPPVQILKIGKLSVPFRPIPIPVPSGSIPGLLKVKRITAGILVLVSVVMAVVSVSVSPLLLLIFIPNAIIHLDYLSKTRQSKKKLWSEKVKDMEG